MTLVAVVRVSASSLPLGFDRTEVVALLTALFTGAIVLATVAIEWRRQREIKRRYELKVLIGEHMDELTAHLLYDNTYAEFTAWWEGLARLIDASLGRGEEQWVLDPLPGGEGVTDTVEQRRAILREIHLRLYDLMGRMDAIPLRPGFDPKAWKSG